MNYINLDTDERTHSIVINGIIPLTIKTITIKLDALLPPKIYINGRKLRGSREEQILKLKSSKYKMGEQSNSQPKERSNDCAQNV